MRAQSIAALILLAAAACTGSDAAFTPAGASRWNDGYPAVVQAVPPGAPTGSLEVASFGFVELTPEDAAPMAMLHVRIAVANDASAVPWTVDLAGATLRAGERETRTLLANSDLATLPIAVVERGEARTIDLYFEPPPGSRDEEDLTELDFRVQLGPRGQMVRTHTHFTRREPAEVPGVRKDAARIAGWGSRWWADPAYPWPTFHKRPGIATPRPPAQATVNRLPRGQRAPQPWSAWR